MLRLSNVKLSDAKLSNAKLSNAKLSDARLSDAKLSKVWNPKCWTWSKYCQWWNLATCTEEQLWVLGWCCGIMSMREGTEQNSPKWSSKWLLSNIRLSWRTCLTYIQYIWNYMKIWPFIFNFTFKGTATCEVQLALTKQLLKRSAPSVHIPPNLYILQYCRYWALLSAPIYLFAEYTSSRSLWAPEDFGQSPHSCLWLLLCSR